MEQNLKYEAEYIEKLIENSDDIALQEILHKLHFADTAELMESLDDAKAIYLFDIMDAESSSEVLLELSDDLRSRILKHLTPKEIAEEIDELSSDDAADIINELPLHKKNEVIKEIEDASFAKDVVDLLRYEEDTAGGIMAKELIKVNENLTVFACVREMRKQATNVGKVHAIYVVDDDDLLLGRLSLSDLLTTSLRTPIKNIFIKDIQFVHVDSKDVEVARKMEKYDLEAIPVVDALGRLVGRVTIDDVVDVIREEAEKDYQLAAGITDDVEVDDSIKDLTKARFPWLVIALFGSLIAVKVGSSFEEALKSYGELFFFSPLIVAMAGNVGVQSSAIIVQGLANGPLSGSLYQRLIKELTLSLLNGVILAVILFLTSHFILGYTWVMGYTLSISLITVIVIASLVGTFVPIVLDKNGIDPALATGPFITTSNDIFGILIYLSIAKWIIGF